MNYAAISLLGGCPDCVKTYRNTGSMIEAFQVQGEILDSYRDDFSKYLPRIDTMCLDAVFLNVARSIGEQLKYTRLNDGHSGQTNRKAFDLLVKARGSNAEVDYLTVYKQIAISTI
jgi:hypothetical protein